MLRIKSSNKARTIDEVCGQPEGSFRKTLHNISVGDLVVTRIKNRLGIECAGTVKVIHDTTADVCVWNMNGPGANMLVTGIPLNELIKDGETPNINL